MPSEAAKKARTWLMKCFSSALSLSQCFMSSPRSTSSAAGTGGSGDTRQHCQHTGLVGGRRGEGRKRS
eukprot:scaffold101579_cov13-Tisochrysis_lutea.AAC.1